LIANRTPDRQEDSTVSTMSRIQRSGWLSFAAVMMFVAAGFYAVWAINLFGDAAWVSSVSNSGIFGGQRWLWGLFDAAMCALFVWVGWNLWTRATSTARLIAVIAASISMFRWFYWLPYAPAQSLAIIVVDGLIIYGVLTTWESDV